MQSIKTLRMINLTIKDNLNIKTGRNKQLYLILVESDGWMDRCV